MRPAADESTAAVAVRLVFAGRTVGGASSAGETSGQHEVFDHAHVLHPHRRARVDGDLPEPDASG